MGSAANTSAFAAHSLSEWTESKLSKLLCVVIVEFPIVKSVGILYPFVSDESMQSLLVYKFNDCQSRKVDRDSK